MTTAAIPLLSVVMTGRNDNHNGDFDVRAEYAIRHNIALLDQFGLNYEYVWVEWNPLPDRPLFAVKIREWIKNSRAFVVTPEIHRHFCDNPSMGVMQFFGKNAGIRRARGEWILSMNADTYLTPEVLGKMHGDNLRKDTFYLATRVDFSRHLLHERPPSYPIADIAGRNAVLVSEMRLPDSYGSAGDFTLMHRDLFLKAGGHYEGIRFSNNHVDTMLGRQIRAMGGSFAELGRVFHADHADSWNNFAAGDAGSHHGCDYNWMKVTLPYSNSPYWGLADYGGKLAFDGIFVLTAPPHVRLRAEVPPEILVPDDLNDLVEFTNMFTAALKEIREKSLRVIIYGLGEQVRKLLSKEEMGDIKILGYIDDNQRVAAGFPHKMLTWDEAGRLNADAILIGSSYWADSLRDKAMRHVSADCILPRKTGNSLFVEGGPYEHIITAGAHVVSCDKGMTGRKTQGVLLIDLGGGTKMEFVRIDTLNGWVGKYAVTNEEYRRYQPDHNSGEYETRSLNGDRQPVVQVSYDDAVAFADWMNRTAELPEGRKCRLPDGSEWLTFAQCGDNRKYPWGNDWPPKHGNYADAALKRGFSAWSVINGYDDGYDVTCPVEESGENDWGLFGVGGNVWQWTSELYDGASTWRVMRGGSWGSSDANSLECASRYWNVPSYRKSSIGFRLLL
jgi:hypothetical protein